jgi:hypothetical protein
LTINRKRNSQENKRNIQDGWKNYSLHVIVVLADHLDVVSHQVDRIKSDSKLADQVQVSAFLQIFHKGCNVPNRADQNPKQVGG